MKVKQFHEFILKNPGATQKFRLSNMKVAVDAQTCLYNLYEESGLPFKDGCESEEFADIFRNKLDQFTKAKLEACFFFKAGHENYEKRKTNYNTGYMQRGDKFVMPVFMEDIHREVLTEKGFRFVQCQNEVKSHCIRFSQKHNCPIISFDSEYLFHDRILYIPSTTLNFESSSNTFSAKAFSLSNFLQNFSLTSETYSIFLVLTAEDTYPKHISEFLFEKLKIENKSIQILLQQLACKEDIFENVLHILERRKTDQEKFVKKYDEVQEYVYHPRVDGIPILYLENSLVFENPDRLWFEKGVVSGFVAKEYVDLYQWGVARGSWSVEERSREDAAWLSVDVVKYAYNLLTNYRKDNFNFYRKDGNVVVVSTKDGVQKPSYVCVDNVFEKGWSGVASLGLFEHFIRESLPNFAFDGLERLPEEERLLMVSLVWVSAQLRRRTAKEGQEGDRAAYGALAARAGRGSGLWAWERNHTDPEHAAVQLQHAAAALGSLAWLCAWSGAGGVVRPDARAHRAARALRTIAPTERRTWLTDKLAPFPQARRHLHLLLDVYDQLVQRLA